MNKILIKNKRCTMLVFCFLFFLNLNSSVLGQSRRETIKWLNTNGISLSQIENNSLYFSILKVDKDSIYYSHNDNNNFEKTYSVSLKNILYEEITTIEKKNNPYHHNITYFAIKVSTFSKEKDKNGRFKKVENITDFLFPYENEEKAVRVVKAIMDLSKLSGARENKQFY